MNTRTRTYNSSQNIIMGFISKVVTALLTFVGRQVFLQFLSLEYLGINGLFGDVLRMLSVADLGFATAMAFFLYKPLVDGDEDRLAALTRYYRNIYNVVAVIVAVIGVILTPFLHYLIKMDNPIPFVEVYYLISLANTVISYLFAYRAAIITADQKGYLVSRYTMWTNVACLAAQIAILYLTRSYLAYCSVTIVATVANNLLIARLAGKEYPFIRKKATLPPADRKDIINNVKSVALYKMSAAVVSGTDNILISVLVGTAFVGQYSNYNVAVNNLSQIAWILFASITPSIGNLIAKEPPHKRWQVFRTIQMVSFWIGGFFIFCLYFLMDGFITLWLGEQYLLGNFSKIAILLNFYLTLCMFPVISFREATGLYQKAKYIMIVTAVLNLILSFALGPRFQVGGILLASCIAKLATYIWYEPVILIRGFFKAPLGNYFLEQLFNAALIIGCILVCQAILPQALGKSWFQWILFGVLYTAIINIVYLIRYGRTPEFQSVKNKFLRKFLRKA